MARGHIVPQGLNLYRVFMENCHLTRVGDEATLLTRNFLLFPFFFFFFFIFLTYGE